MEWVDGGQFARAKSQVEDGQEKNRQCIPIEWNWLQLGLLYKGTDKHVKLSRDNTWADS